MAAKDKNADTPPADTTTGDSAPTDTNLPSENPEGDLGTDVTDAGAADPAIPATFIPITEDDTDRPTAEQVQAESLEAGHISGQRPGVTVAEGEVPGGVEHTAPGDAPADTTDPNEMISTIIPDAESQIAATLEGRAMVGYVKTGTAIPAGTIDSNRDTSQDRYEEYEVRGVQIRRNMETGESVRI